MLFLDEVDSLTLLYINNWDLIHAAYLVVADEAVGRQIPFAFLERVKDDFKRRFGGGRADTAVAHGLDREFG